MSLKELFFQPRKVALQATLAPFRLIQGMLLHALRYGKSALWAVESSADQFQFIANQDKLSLAPDVLFGQPRTTVSRPPKLSGGLDVGFD
jgi:hypothetical protein